MKNSNLANEIAQMREVAKEDADLSAKNGIDLNPFSTSGGRKLWQSGWDGVRPRNLTDTSIDWRFWERGRQAKILFKEAEGPQKPTMAAERPKLCLHVTSAAAIKSIMSDCLRPQLGPMSKLRGEVHGVFMFPSWEDLEAANWLFDGWLHSSEPALLCVNVELLNLESEVGYEVVSREQIHTDRITVLAPGEENWQQAKETFLKMGGLGSADVQNEPARGEAPRLR